MDKGQPKETMGELMTDELIRWAILLNWRTNGVRLCGIRA